MTLQQRIDAKKHQLFFIELNKDVVLGDKTFSKGLDLPVDPDAIKEMVTENKDHFNFKEMLRDMCLIIGLDPEFNHYSTYRQMVAAAISNPYSFCMSLGVANSTRGLWIEALAFFKAALVFDDQFDPHYHLGRVHYAMVIGNEKTDGALAMARHYFELANQVEHRAEVDYYLTFILHLEERHIEALKMAQEAIKGDLEESLSLDLLGKMAVLEDRATYQMGVDFIMDERFQEGLEALLSLSENTLDDWRVQFFIGLGYRGIFQLHQSLQHLLRAKALNPAEDRILNELGVVAMMLEDYKGAKAFFEEGLKIKPLSSDLLCNMGILLIESGDWTLAEKFVDEALKTNREDPIILQTKQHILQNKPQ